jgi:hypothetical protein
VQQQLGTITSDGSSYQVCLVNRGGGYMQNWSVRQQKRSTGVVTTANHYNYYAAHGGYNPLSQAVYQIMSTEGYQSSGSASITVSDAGSGSSPPPSSSSSPRKPASSLLQWKHVIDKEYSIIHCLACAIFYLLITGNVSHQWRWRIMLGPVGTVRRPGLERPNLLCQWHDVQVLQPLLFAVPVDASVVDWGAKFQSNSI